MQGVISACLLVSTPFVILSAKYDANSKHWAFATVGTILGFWLKGCSHVAVSVRDGPR